MTSKERWVPILDYPDYEVSDWERARSRDRTILTVKGQLRTYRGRILVQVMAGGTKGRRYPSCTLYRDGKPRQVRIHVVMLESFVGPRPPGMEALHRDDDPMNRSLENLYWGTPIQNAKDKIRNGNCRKSNITECPQGHEYTEENTYRAPSTGHRQCRTCIKAKNKGNANADRTECPQGHPYDEVNTYHTKAGRRMCRTCVRDRAREYQRNKRRNA